MAHLQSWRFFRISDCENVLQIKTGDIIHGARGPGPATYKIDLMLYVAGPGPLIKHLFDDSGARQPKLCFRCCALRREATVQRTSQGRTTKSANDCNDWRDIFAKGAGMVYSATLKSTRKPRHLEMHLGARVQSDGTIFPGVRDHESLPGSTGVILAASHQLVQSMLNIWWDTWLRP